MAANATNVQLSSLASSRIQHDEVGPIDSSEMVSPALQIGHLRSSGDQPVTTALTHVTKHLSPTSPKGTTGSSLILGVPTDKWRRRHPIDKDKPLPPLPPQTDTESTEEMSNRDATAQKRGRRRIIRHDRSRTFRSPTIDASRLQPEGAMALCSTNISPSGSPPPGRRAVKLSSREHSLAKGRSYRSSSIYSRSISQARLSSMAPSGRKQHHAVKKEPKVVPQVVTQSRGPRRNDLQQTRNISSHLEVPEIALSVQPCLTVSSGASTTVLREPRRANADTIEGTMLTLELKNLVSNVAGSPPVPSREAFDLPAAHLEQGPTPAERPTHPQPLSKVFEVLERQRRQSAPPASRGLLKSNMHESNHHPALQRALSLPPRLSLSQGKPPGSSLLVCQPSTTSSKGRLGSRLRTTLSSPRLVNSSLVRTANVWPIVNDAIPSPALNSFSARIPVKSSIRSLRQQKAVRQEDVKLSSRIFLSRRRQAGKATNNAKIDSDADDTDSMSSPSPWRRHQERERGRSRTARSRRGSPLPSTTSPGQESQMRSSAELSSQYEEQKLRNASQIAQEYQNILDKRARQPARKDGDPAAIGSAQNKLRRKTKQSSLVQHGTTGDQNQTKRQDTEDGSEITLCLNVCELPYNVQVSPQYFASSPDTESTTPIRIASTLPINYPYTSFQSDEDNCLVNQPRDDTDLSLDDQTEDIRTPTKWYPRPRLFATPVTALRGKVPSRKLSLTSPSKSPDSASPASSARSSSNNGYSKRVSPTWWIAKDSRENPRRQILAPLVVPKHRRLDSGIKLDPISKPLLGTRYSVSSGFEDRSATPISPIATIDGNIHGMERKTDRSIEVRRSTGSSSMLSTESSPDDVSSIFSLYMDVMIDDITKAVKPPPKIDAPPNRTLRTPTLRENAADDARSSPGSSSDSLREGATSSMGSSQYTSNNDRSIDGSIDDDSDGQTIHASTPKLRGVGFPCSLDNSMAANLLSPWSLVTDAEPTILAVPTTVAKQIPQPTVADESMGCSGSVARFSWEATEDSDASKPQSQSPELKACVAELDNESSISNKLDKSATLQKVEEVRDNRRSSERSIPSPSGSKRSLQLPEVNIVPPSETGTPRSLHFPRISPDALSSVSTASMRDVPSSTLQRGDSKSGCHSRTQVDDLLDKLYKLNGYTRNKSPPPPTVGSIEYGADHIGPHTFSGHLNSKRPISPFLTEGDRYSKPNLDFKLGHESHDDNLRIAGENERVKSWQSLNLLPMDRFGSDRAFQQSRLHQVATFSDDSESDSEPDNDGETRWVVTGSENEEPESDQSEDDSVADESDDHEVQSASEIQSSPNSEPTSNHHLTSDSDNSTGSFALRDQSSDEQRTVTLATDMISVIPIRPESIRSIMIHRSLSSHRATTHVEPRDYSLATTRIQERLRALPPLDTRTRSALSVVESNAVASESKESEAPSSEIDRKEIVSQKLEMTTDTPALANPPAPDKSTDDTRRSRRTLSRASRRLRLLRKMKKTNRKDFAVRVTSIRASKGDLLSVLASSDPVHGVGERNLTRIPLKLVAPQPRTSDIMQLQQKPNLRDDRSLQGNGGWAAATLDLIHQRSHASAGSSANRSTNPPKNRSLAHSTPSTGDPQWEDVDDTDISGQKSAKSTTPATIHPAFSRISPRQSTRSQPQTPASDVVPFQTFALRNPPPPRPLHRPGPPPREPPPPPPPPLPVLPAASPSRPPLPPPKEYPTVPSQPRSQPSIASGSTVHPYSTPTTIPTPSIVTIPGLSAPSLDLRQLDPPPLPPPPKGYQPSLLRSDSDSIAVSAAPAPEIPRHNPHCPIHGMGKDAPIHSTVRFHRANEDRVREPSCPEHGAPTSFISQKKPLTRNRFFAASKKRRASVRVDWEQASRIAATAGGRREAALAAEAAARAKKRHEDLQELIRGLPRGESLVRGEGSGGGSGGGRKKARKRELYRMALKAYGFM